MNEFHDEDTERGSDAQISGAAGCLVPLLLLASSVAMILGAVLQSSTLLGAGALGVILGSIYVLIRTAKHRS